MLRYNELVKVYNELASMSRYDRMHNAKAAYEKLESLLQEKMGHGPGYFAATRVACALVAADGQLTRAEHEMFREFATSSCTYDELYDTISASYGAGDIVPATCAKVDKDGNIEEYEIEFKLMEDTSGDY